MAEPKNTGGLAAIFQDLQYVINTIKGKCDEAITNNRIGQIDSEYGGLIIYLEGGSRLNALMEDNKLLLTKTGELSISETGKLLTTTGGKKRTKTTRRKHLAKKRKTAVRLRKIKGGVGYIHVRRSHKTPEESARELAEFIAGLKALCVYLFGQDTSVHENTGVQLLAELLMYVVMIYGVVLSLFFIAELLQLITERNKISGRPFNTTKGLLLHIPARGATVVVSTVVRSFNGMLTSITTDSGENPFGWLEKSVRSVLKNVQSVQSVQSPRVEELDSAGIKVTPEATTLSTKELNDAAKSFLVKKNAHHLRGIALATNEKLRKLTEEEKSALLAAYLKTR
jgi:hypothetical protein